MNDAIDERDGEKRQEFVEKLVVGVAIGVVVGVFDSGEMVEFVAVEVADAGDDAAEADYKANFAGHTHKSVWAYAKIEYTDKDGAKNAANDAFPGFVGGYFGKWSG